MFGLFLPQKVAALYLSVAHDSECNRKISVDVLFAENKMQEIKQALVLISFNKTSFNKTINSLK